MVTNEINKLLEIFLKHFNDGWNIKKFRKLLIHFKIKEDSKIAKSLQSKIIYRVNPDYKNKAKKRAMKSSKNRILTEEQRQRKIEYMKQYNKKNKEKSKKYYKDYYKLYGDEIRTNVKKRYAENIEKNRIHLKEKYIRNLSEENRTRYFQKKQKYL